MKILNPIGSKERFFEMYQGVNKMQLNEVATNTMQTGTQLVEKAFNELKNNEINIKQTNTQAVDDGNFVEIIANDNNGNEITFTFKINSSEGDQEGVYNVNSAVLTNFKVQSDRFNVDFPENMKAVEEFNNNYGNEIISVVEPYIDLETDTVSIDDEIYEEAIGLIDKIPFEKGSEEIQTHSAYADEKPTNPDLRVHSDELDSFVSEMEDYVKNAEDELDLPPDYNETTPIADDGTKGIDPYDQAIADAQAGNDDWEISNKRPEKPKKSPPYMDDTGDKKRAIPSWAEDLLEDDGMGNILSPEMKEKYIREAIKILRTDTTIQQPQESYIDTVKRLAMQLAGQSSMAVNEKIGDVKVHADDILFRNYDDLLTPEAKKKYIIDADKELTNSLGDRKHQMSTELYNEMVKTRAVELYEADAMKFNEEKEKNDYPDQIGKKFKPKNQFPKKKKKPQSVVKLGEEDEPIKPAGEYGSIVVGDNLENLTNLDFEDKLEGGLADNKEPQDFDPKQLAMGLEVEMEHTDDPKLALEIAMDHLVEIPDYYTHLDKMEKEAGVEQPENQNLVDDETDELLGYKPFNVNDYTNEDLDDYAGDIGDRYQDGEGNQLTVKSKDDSDGTIKLQGQEGEKEIDTSDVQLLKKISEEKENNKEVITEEQVKVARQVLKDRDFSKSMTKNEAVQILIKHNIR